MLIFEDLIKCQPMYPDYLLQLDNIHKGKKAFIEELELYENYYCVAIDMGTAYILKMDDDSKIVDHILAFDVTKKLDFSLLYNMPLGSNPRCYQMECFGEQVTRTSFGDILDTLRIPYNNEYFGNLLEYWPKLDYLAKMPAGIFDSLLKYVKNYNRIDNDKLRRSIMPRFLYIWAKNIKEIIIDEDVSIATIDQRRIMRDILEVDKIHDLSDFEDNREKRVKRICREYKITYEFNLEDSIRSLLPKEKLQNKMSLDGMGKKELSKETPLGYIPNEIDLSIIDEIINRYPVVSDKNILVGSPQISGDWEYCSIVYKNCNIPQNEKIYLVVDTTLFHSLKKIFVIASSGIYYNFKKPQHLKWEDFINIKFERVGNSISFVDPNLINKVINTSLINLGAADKKAADKVYQIIIELQKKIRTTYLYQKNNLDITDDISIDPELLSRILNRYRRKRRLSKIVEFGTPNITDDFEYYDTIIDRLFIPESVPIYLAVNSAVFKKYTCGFALTGNGLYYRASDSVFGHYSWADFKNLRISISMTGLIIGDNVYSLGLSTQDEIEELLISIQRDL